MAKLDDVDPLDGAARSYAARILRERRIHPDITLTDEKRLADTTDWDVIFSAEAELISQLPPDALRRRAWLIYDRFTDVAGADKAAHRSAAAATMKVEEIDDKDLRDRREIALLRADLLEVHNETARQYMTNFQLERQRTALAFLVMSISAVALLAFVGFIFWPFLQRECGTRNALLIYGALVLAFAAAVSLYRWYRARRWRRAETHEEDQNAGPAAMATFLVPLVLMMAGNAQAQTPQQQALVDLPIVPLVILAGILGATFSILQRVQRSTAADPLVALFNLRAARSQIILSIVSGAIGSLVVFAVFAGGMIEGGLFPKIANATSPTDCRGLMKLVSFLQNTGPCTHTDYGKLLVWAFIAGFAERFVPDILDKFTESAKK